MGILAMTGNLGSLAIGGQELRIDHVCPVYIERELEIVEFLRSGGAALLLCFVCTEEPQPVFSVERTPVLGPDMHWDTVPEAVITPLGCGRFEALVPLVNDNLAAFYRIVGTPPSTGP